MIPDMKRFFIAAAAVLALASCSVKAPEGTALFDFFKYEGADDFYVQNPLPGDDIIGYITRGYGVSIHKRDCTNVPKDLNDSEEPERWVSARWEHEAGETFRSTLQIVANDRTGLLADVTIQLSNMHIFIHTLNSRELKNGKAVVTVTIDVAGKDHLRGVISRMSEIKGIEEIKRL